MIKPGNVFRMVSFPDTICGIVLEHRFVEYLIVVLQKKNAHTAGGLWTPMLIGITMDIKFLHRHWLVVGDSIETSNAMPRPVYRLMSKGDVVYEDFQARRIETGSLENSGILPMPRTTVGPIRFENASMALLGRDEWAAEFDVIKYDNYFAYPLIKKYEMSVR